jgi:hypothetical protein
MSLARTMQRKAVKELLKGNQKPAAKLAEKLSEQKKTFNCGTTLSRKFKTKVER